ncbi:phosphotransferase enzyme family protein [Rossellomorea marisflavi]|uniref:phosphotransferase enzyme family protein n=1 Tax=Rossellomorea marisflavi TaxID=189381 RepID=UPI003D2EC6E5
MNSIDVLTLCKLAGIGLPKSDPTPVSGGLLHKMYQLKTTNGTFALKRLNPEIMKRPEALENYRKAEKITRHLAGEIPAVPSLVVDDNALLEVGGNYHLLFPWVDGKQVDASDIDGYHCEAIGGILGIIHKKTGHTIETPSHSPEEIPIHWVNFVQPGKEAGWGDLLETHLVELEQWTEKAVAARNRLLNGRVLSHRDLDSKNVLWQASVPVIIDWESAGPIHPVQDVMETAVYWSQSAEASVDRQKLLPFVNQYETVMGKGKRDYKRGLEASILSKLNWLEYNMKRSLGLIAVSDADRLLGTEQVTETILDLARFTRQIPDMVDWLEKDPQEDSTRILSNKE